MLADHLLRSPVGECRHRVSRQTREVHFGSRLRQRDVQHLDDDAKKTITGAPQAALPGDFMSDFTVPEHLPDWISSHVRLYLDSGGKEGHQWDSTPVGGPGLLPCLLLVTTGRKSGKKITVPLIYGETGDGRYVIIASRGGTPAHPDWYFNLTKNPQVQIQIGTKRFTAVASTCEDASRDKLWKAMATIYPPYDAYQGMTERRIPVVVLEPQGEAQSA